MANYVSSPSNYCMLIEYQRAIGPTLSRLKTLGITILPYGELHFSWETKEILESKFFNVKFGHEYFMPSLKHKICFSLALLQEQINSNICHDEIDFLNNFFKVSISEKDIIKANNFLFH